MLTSIIIISLLNATLLQCFRKWHWLEWYAIHKADYLPDAGCFLCLSFWLAAIECIILFYYFLDPKFLIIPFCACALTNFIINATIVNDYRNDK
jgi:hypothetical protein